LTRLARRAFLQQVQQGAAAGLAAGAIGPAMASAAAGGAPTEGRVRRRRLGKSDVEVSEIGFGGHGWAYKRTPDGHGGMRQVTVDEAVISVRVSHKMKGVENDKQEIYAWTEDRLRRWRTDCIDVLMLSNEVRVTDKSGYWDMTHSIEAVQKLKQQGKIRLAGFGSHFEPRWFYEAFEKFAPHFDVCSMPYNIRHRVAEEVMPAAKKAGLGVITIKPLARGSLLSGRDLAGPAQDLPRDSCSSAQSGQTLTPCPFLRGRGETPARVIIPEGRLLTPAGRASGAWPARGCS